MGGGADGRRPFSFAVCHAFSHCDAVIDTDPESDDAPDLQTQLLAARRDILRQLEILDVEPAYGGSAYQRRLSADALKATLGEIEQALAQIDESQA